MTVIAYRDGILAVDSLCSTEGMIMPIPPKLRPVPGRAGWFLATAGSLGDGYLFEEWLADGAPKGARPEVEDFEAVVLGPEGAWWYGDALARVPLDGLDWFAGGAGQEMATAAMATGAGAVRACLVACRWRTDCGEPVFWIDRREGRIRQEVG